MRKNVNVGKVALACDSLLAEASHTSIDKLHSTVGEPLPRSVRRKRKSEADRGLPAESEIANLARNYLGRQRKLWPGLVGSLPEPTDLVIAAMTAGYIARHRGGAPDSQAIRAAAGSAKLAGAYCRISCDKNNPLSIGDPLRNILERARAEKRFVPREYGYADFAVTGMNATRQGYQSYMAVLKDKHQAIDTTFIDDFTRASRDELEWWTIAAASKRLRKRMIGASDGVDLNSDPLRDDDFHLRLTFAPLLGRTS